MIFDTKNLSEIEELDGVTLANRNSFIDEEIRRKKIERDHKLKEIDDINLYLDELYNYKKSIEIAQSKEIDTCNYRLLEDDIIGKYFLLKSIDAKDKMIEELPLDETVFLNILKRDSHNYEVYDLQLHLLDIKELSAEFLKEVVDLELDKGMFKLDLKLKALKHPNIDESAIERALEDDFIDMRYIGAKLAIEKGIERLLPKAIEVIQTNKDFSQIVNAKRALDMLLSGEIPHMDRGKIEKDLDFYEEHLSLLKESDFVEYSKEDLKIAREVLNH